MTDQQRAVDAADHRGGQAAGPEPDQTETHEPAGQHDPSGEDAADPAPATAGGDDPAGTAPTGEPHQEVSEQTVETVIRAQLSKALGGKRGMLEAAVPTIAFTVTYLTLDQLKLALGLGVGAAVVLAVIRLVQRSSVQFVVNSLFGIGIAALFALRSGDAEDAFLPGILYNAGYAVVLTLSILVRWPVIGLLIGSVTGDPTGWRANPAVVRLSSRLTWLLVLPCVVRVVVQYPLWAAAKYEIADTFAYLGAAKIVMGWPLQVAAFAAMVWLLARGRTPMRPAPTG